MDYTEREELGISRIFHNYFVVKVLFSFKDDIFSKVKALISDKKVVILNNMNLSRRLISNLSAEGIDSIVIGIRVEKEGNRLRNREQ